MATIISPKVGKKLPRYIEKDEMKVLFGSVEFPDTWDGKTQDSLLNFCIIRECGKRNY
jgi:hypothetical protein